MATNLSKEENLEYALDAISGFENLTKHFHKGSVEKFYIRAEQSANEVDWDEVSEKIKDRYEKALEEANNHYDEFK